MPPDSKMMDRLREQARLSKIRRADVVRAFGLVPLSILRMTRGGLRRSLFSYQGSAPERVGTNDEFRRTDGARRAWDETRALVSTWRSLTNSSSRGTRLSTNATAMPPELVGFFVKFYGVEGKVYLDPFAGHGVRAQVAHATGMEYWGKDASAEFVGFIRSFVPKLTHPERVHIFLGDSRDPYEVPDGIGDFCFTSPPYWDAEWYGDEKEQLARCPTYGAFIESMGEIGAAWLPKFRPGAICVVNVGDLRRDGALLPYHSDLTVAWRAAGWAVHDIWIIDGLATLRRAFAVGSVRARVAPRVHEYALVFRAP